MQVGEVDSRSRRTIDRHEIRLQLDQVARHEPRREPKMPRRLHQKPARIPARSNAALERLFRRLHARLHADDIAYRIRDGRVHHHDEVDRPQPVLRNAGKELLEVRPHRLGLAIDRQVVGDLFWIFERPSLRALLHEEVERVVHRHVRDEVDLNLQLAHRLGKHIPRQPVAIEILLVIHEMLRGRNLQRMRNHPRPRVRGRPQPDNLRPQHHRLVIAIVSEVINRSFDRHGPHRSTIRQRGPALVRLQMARAQFCGAAFSPSSSPAKRGRWPAGPEGASHMQKR